MLQKQQTCFTPFFMSLLIAFVIFLAFFVSASCGLGGSLILIPVLSAVLGIKEGIVISSILLGLNNIIKVIFFRGNIKFKPVSFLMILMMAGAVIGSFMMLKANSHILTIFLVFNIAISFLIQQYTSLKLQKNAGLIFSFLSGFCSGLSGTSGPLKGLAVKCHMHTKMEIVAAASLLSLATDSVKSVIYLSQSTPSALSFEWLVYSVAVMPVATAMEHTSIVI